jgi:hypothetical protein
MKFNISSSLASMKLMTALVVAAMITGASIPAHAQNWTQHVDWAATNTGAGGSVDCPVNYVSMGVEYAVVAGGRAAVINQALFAAYRGEEGRAFQLVLLTQCHNPGAHQELMQAGQQAVVGYLVRNWQPQGLNPDDIKRGIQGALTYLVAG